MPARRRPPPRSSTAWYRRRTAWFAAVVGGALAGCEADLATPAVDRTDPSPADAAAREVVEQMAAVYRGATSYFDNAEYRESFLRQGEASLIEPPAHQVAVVFERPNRFRITRRVPAAQGPGLTVALASDGEAMAATISDLPGQRLEAAAPEALSGDKLVADPVLREALLPVPLENLFPQLDLLLASDDAPPRLLGDAAVSALPPKAIGDAVCHRVELARPAGAFVLWIDQQTHLLRRVEIPTDQLREQLDPRGVMLQWRLWIDLHDAAIGGRMADDVFTLPESGGARSVAAFEKSS